MFEQILISLIIPQVTGAENAERNKEKLTKTNIAEPTLVSLNYLVSYTVTSLVGTG